MTCERKKDGKSERFGVRSDQIGTERKKEREKKIFWFVSQIELRFNSKVLLSIRIIQTSCRDRLEKFFKCKKRKWFDDDGKREEKEEKEEKRRKREARNVLLPCSHKCQ